MKGHDEVIRLLNDVLTAELTAINQYFIHARMNENWGYKKLAAYVLKESMEEMRHAQDLIDRILYFDGAPNMQKYMKINVGKTVTWNGTSSMRRYGVAINRNVDESGASQRRRSSVGWRHEIKI